MNLAPRIAALETRIPVPIVAMDHAEALAAWAEMEAELADADLSAIGITAHQAWANYRDCLNA